MEAKFSVVAPTIPMFLPNLDTTVLFAKRASQPVVSELSAGSPEKSRLALRNGALPTLLIKSAVTSGPKSKSWFPRQMASISIRLNTIPSYRGSPFSRAAVNSGPARKLSPEVT